MKLSLAVVACTAVTAVVCARPEAVEVDQYDALLNATALPEQRAALDAIVRAPGAYVPRIQQTLRDYPTVLAVHPVAAQRSVYAAALVRDSSFAPILAMLLTDSTVVEECSYACPVVFALAQYGAFEGWRPPATLDTSVSTVADLRNEIARVSKQRLDVRPIDSVVQGPMVERNRKEIDGKSEEQLIELAGLATTSADVRQLAATALQTSVATSRNRRELYLLLMNEPRNDASMEYRSAIYEAVYRAETARARGK